MTSSRATILEPRPVDSVFFRPEDLARDPQPKVEARLPIPRPRLSGRELFLRIVGRFMRVLKTRHGVELDLAEMGRGVLVLRGAAVDVARYAEDLGRFEQCFSAETRAALRPALDALGPLPEEAPPSLWRSFARIFGRALWSQRKGLMPWYLACVLLTRLPGAAGRIFDVVVDLFITYLVVRTLLALVDLVGHAVSERRAKRAARGAAAPGA